MDVQRLLEAKWASQPTQRQKTPSLAHQAWAENTEPNPASFAAKQKHHLPLQEGEPFFHELRSRSSARLSSRELEQFIFAENLVHKSILIFLLLLRFTYIPVFFRESFIVVTGEKPKRDLCKCTSKPYRIWIRSFPWVIPSMGLAGCPTEFNGLDRNLNKIPYEWHTTGNSFMVLFIFGASFWSAPRAGCWFNSQYQRM